MDSIGPRAGWEAAGLWMLPDRADRSDRHDWSVFGCGDPAVARSCIPRGSVTIQCGRRWDRNRRVGVRDPSAPGRRGQAGRTRSCNPGDRGFGTEALRWTLRVRVELQSGGAPLRRSLVGVAHPGGIVAARNTVNVRGGFDQGPATGSLLCASAISCRWGWASCQAVMAASHSSPPRAVSDVGNRPSSSLAMCSCRLSTARLTRSRSRGSDRSTASSRAASSRCARTHVVRCARRTARPFPGPRTGRPPLPVRPEFLAHRGQQFAGAATVGPVQGSDCCPAEVDGSFILGDVVPQQRHIPATAVVTHQTSATSSARSRPLGAGHGDREQHDGVLQRLKRMSGRRHDQKVPR